MKKFFKLNIFLKIGIFSLNFIFTSPYRKFSGEDLKHEDKSQIAEKNNISYKFFLKKISDLEFKNLEFEESNFIKKLKKDPCPGYLIYLNKKDNGIVSIENKGENFCIGVFSDTENEITLNILYLKILGVTNSQQNKIVNSIFRNREIFEGIEL